MALQEPQVLVERARVGGEDVGGVRVAGIVGRVDCLASGFAQCCEALDERLEVVLDLADVRRIGREFCCLADRLDGPQRNAVKLGDAFGDDVDVLIELFADFVEEFVDGDEGRPLDVPVGLLGDERQVDGVGEPRIEQLDRSTC